MAKNQQAEFANKPQKTFDKWLEIPAITSGIKSPLKNMAVYLGSVSWVRLMAVGNYLKYKVRGESYLFYEGKQTRKPNVWTLFLW